MPPVDPRDRLPQIDEPFGPTDLAPVIDPRESLQPVDPKDRFPIDPRDRLPQIDPRDSLPQVDPRGTLLPLDRPVSPSGIRPPLPLPPVSRDPFQRNQETPISPYPKGEYIYLECLCVHSITYFKNTNTCIISL